VNQEATRRLLPRELLEELYVGAEMTAGTAGASKSARRHGTFVEI